MKPATTRQIFNRNPRRFLCTLHIVTDTGGKVYADQTREALNENKVWPFLLSPSNVSKSFIDPTPSGGYRHPSTRVVWLLAGHAILPPDITLTMMSDLIAGTTLFVPPATYGNPNKVILTWYTLMEGRSPNDGKKPEPWVYIQSTEYRKYQPTNFRFSWEILEKARKDAIKIGETIRLLEESDSAVKGDDGFDGMFADLDDVDAFTGRSPEQDDSYYGGF